VPLLGYEKFRIREFLERADNLMRLKLLITIVLAVVAFVRAASAAQAQPALPLHRAGPYIVDSNGERVHLNAVSWYGAESRDFVSAVSIWLLCRVSCRKSRAWVSMQSACPGRTNCMKATRWWADMHLPQSRHGRRGCTDNSG